MTPFIGVRNLVRHIGEKIGFGAARPFGGFTRLLGLVARRGYLLLGGLAHGNVGECPDGSAAGQWNIVEFDKSPIRPPPLAHLRLFESAASPDDLFQCLVIPIFLLSPLPCEDVVEMRLNRHQLRRQIHNFDSAAIAKRNHAVSIDHHDALVHVFEGRFEKLRFFSEAPFAFAQRIGGLLQFLSVQFEACPILLELAKLSAKLSKQSQEAEDCAYRADCNEC